MVSERESGAAALGAERIAQLEDEMVSMRRMLMLQIERNDLSASHGGGGGAPTWDGLGKPSGDKSGLWSIVTRLETEVQVERQSRMTLEGKLLTLEDAVTRERQSREAQFRTFSTELESNIRHLVGKLEDDLAMLVKQNLSGPNSLNQTAPASAIATPQPGSGNPITEARLRTLIKRVDEGLTMGVAALQDQLTTTHGGTAPTPSQEDLKNVPQPRMSMRMANTQAPQAPTPSQEDLKTVPQPRMSMRMGATQAPTPSQEDLKNVPQPRMSAVNPGSGGGNRPSGVPMGSLTPGPESSTRNVSPVRVIQAAPSPMKDTSLPSPTLPEQTPLAMAVVPENLVPDVDQMSSDQMIQSWDLLQQENRRLKEKRAQALRQRSPTTASAPRSPAPSSAGPRTPNVVGSMPGSMVRPGSVSAQQRMPAGTAAPSAAATPSRGYAQTVQVPGSGMNALRGGVTPGGRQ